MTPDQGMTRKKFSLLILATIISGLIGGALAETFFQPEARAVPANILTGNELRLVDESGRTRILMSILRGRPRLLLLDEKGEFRIEMGMDANGEPSIWLRDQRGRARSQLVLTAAGNPSLEFTDAQGANRGTFGLQPSGSPALFLRDENGRERLAVWQEKGEQGLALADQKGRPRAGLALKNDRAPSLAFYDEQRKVIWQAPGK